MKIKSLTGAPPFGAQFGPTSGGGLTMQGPLVLSGLPVNPLQASAKSYVDTNVTVIPAEKLTTGTLAASRFPEFTGDLTKQAGFFTITLSNNGITTGTYPKYSIDAKGRVASGASLVASDIPNLSWGKLTTGKPTTLNGYGISDALLKSGDTFTNFLTLNNNPTANLHAANKLYVDTKVTSNPKYATGDVMRRPSTVTPSGFLRANGGELVKTSYNALYSAIGDTHNIIHQQGNGQPWNQQYEINTTQSDKLTGWTNHSTLSYYPGEKTAIVLKNRVYLINVNNTSTMGYSNTIDATGNLSTTWSTSGALALPAGTRLYCTTLVVRNRLHLMGGYDNNGTWHTDTFSAPINADGTIGAWVTGPVLPQAMSRAQAIYTKDRVYLFGGEVNGYPVDAVLTAPVNADGTLGAWSTSMYLPFPLMYFTTLVVKNRLYIFGGYSASSGNYRSNIYYAPINADGTLGLWTSAGNLPSISAMTNGIVTKNRVYLLTGYNGSTRTQTVWSSTFNSDGSLNGFALDSTMSNGLDSPSVIGTSSKVYFVGVLNGGSSYYCVSANWTGSPNDYAPYYNGTFLPTSSANFRLPDYSKDEVGGMYYFVKT